MNEKRVRFFVALSLCVILYVFARVISLALVGDHASYTPHYDKPTQYVQLLSEKLENVQGFKGKFYLFNHMNDDILGGYIDADISLNLQPNMIGDILYRSKREDISEEIQYYFEQIGSEFNIYAKEEVWTGRNVGGDRQYDMTNVYYIPFVIERLIAYGEDFQFGAATKTTVELHGVLPSDTLYDFLHQYNFFALIGGTDVERSVYDGVPDVAFILIVAHDGTPVALQIELGEVLEVVINNVKNTSHNDDAYVQIQQFYVEQTLEQFNEVIDVQIPAEAYDGINYQLESMMIEAQLFLAQEMYW